MVSAEDAAAHAVAVASEVDSEVGEIATMEVVSTAEVIADAVVALAEEVEVVVRPDLAVKVTGDARNPLAVT